MAKDEYDLLVIGSGAAGSSAVTTVAKDGRRVALVERHLRGGTLEEAHASLTCAVALPALPSRLAVIGGGTIGLEFAQIFHRFGVDVPLLERGPTILDKEDRERAEKLCTLLKEEGIRLETDSELRRVQRDGAYRGSRCENDQ
jgi:pyruvate/2-oxoglutarate dehydrogenase complex dihydrolipoamide dehydrogenase (E3) component